MNKRGRNQQKDANLLTMKMLSAQQMASMKSKSIFLLQWNPSLGEILDQVHFSCWKLF